MNTPSNSELRDFQQFCRRVHGTELSETQLKMYEAVKGKRTLFLPRKAGTTYFNQMWREYNDRLKATLKDEVKS